MEDVPNTDLMSPIGSDLAMDQPPWAGWRKVREGLWRGPRGQVWRGWEVYGSRAGHYPGADWARRAARGARAAESDYARRLRQVARTIGDTVRGVFNPSNYDDPGFDTILDMLSRYREMLRPWAHAAATRMLTDVSRRDAHSWHQLGKQINRSLREEIEGANTSSAMEQLYYDQMEAIMNLPGHTSEMVRQSKEASADIIWELRSTAREAVITGARQEDILSGDVRERWQAIVERCNNAGLTARANAETVARTETARAHTVLQAVRAKHIGSTRFKWVTAGDVTVRHLHRNLALGLNADGQPVGLGDGEYEWNNPPELDDGRPGLPGTIWNCRCYARPILPALDI